MNVESSMLANELLQLLEIQTRGRWNCVQHYHYTNHLLPCQDLNGWFESQCACGPAMHLQALAGMMETVACHLSLILLLIIIIILEMMTVKIIVMNMIFLVITT